MAQADLEALQRLLDVVENDESLPKDEFDAIIDEVQTGKKYSVESYNMFCTSENIIVICDMETEEFTQIEVPMEADEDGEVVVTRDA